MAEALLRHELARRSCDDVDVVSAGTWGIAGSPATADAVDVLRAQGVDLSSHRARALEPDQVRQADVVIAMTSVHRREIHELVPEAAGKVFLMKELVELELAATPAGSPRETRLRAVLEATRPPWRRELDLDDPMGLPRSAYERAFRELAAGVSILADVLCSNDEA